jgi:hypothetical protein
MSRINSVLRSCELMARGSITDRCPRQENCEIAEIRAEPVGDPADSDRIFARLLFHCVVGCPIVDSTDQTMIREVANHSALLARQYEEVPNTLHELA